MPRLAAIERPLGYLLGQPGDKNGQLAVLTATLQLLAEIKKPGSVVPLPFEWPETANGLNSHPEEQPPIVKYLLRHPWNIPNLLKRNIPADALAIAWRLEPLSRIENLAEEILAGRVRGRVVIDIDG